MKIDPRKWQLSSTRSLLQLIHIILTIPPPNHPQRALRIPYLLPRTHSLTLVQPQTKPRPHRRSASYHRAQRFAGSQSLGLSPHDR